MNAAKMNYSVLKEIPSESFLGPDLTVLFLLEGRMSVHCQEETYSLETNDIILINPGVYYELRDLQDAIYGMAFYSLSSMTELFDSHSFSFHCNSAADRTRSYEDLLQIFHELTTVYADGKKQTNCLLNSLLLKLLDCLIEHYQLRSDSEAGTEEGSGRMQMIMQYILTNLGSEVSLHELAVQMYLSPSTLSRFFRKNTGLYFADFVMRLRVQSALGLLNHTDQTITQIALTCGFSGSAAFNRAFRKIMGITPSEYREQNRSAIAAESAANRSREAGIRQELLEKGYHYQNQEEQTFIEADLKHSSTRLFRKSWNRMINIGPAWDLTKANVQFHTLYLNEHLGFRYIRIWNIFSKKMMIHDGRTIGQYNYSIIDQVLDFLVQHKLKPFLDMGKRPDTALRAFRQEVFYEEQYISFESREVWERLVEDFLTHLSERYGLEEVSGWIIELSRDFAHEDQHIYQDDCYDFFEAYRFLYQSVRKHLPGTQFGGIGHDILIDWNYITQFFHRCRENDLKPDFVSFIMFPDEARLIGESGMKLYAQEGVPSEAVQISRILKLMDMTGMTGSMLYITEWNNTISNRNPLNDSCFRSSYIVKNLSEFEKDIDMVGIMSGTDWVSSYLDTSGIAHGGIGLLTKDALHKPAWYALLFLNQLGNNLLSKGPNHIITRRENGDIYMLCFYHSALQPDHFRPDAFSPNEYDSIRVRDKKPLILDISLKSISDSGTYCIKKRTLNKEHGSLPDEWKKLQYDTRLTRNDIKYLEASCTPSLSLFHTRVMPDLVLNFQITVLPQEISLIHIFRRK